MTWGLNQKLDFFHFGPDFDGFWFFTAGRVVVKHFFFKVGQKLLVVGDYFKAPMYAYNVHFEKFKFFIYL